MDRVRDLFLQMNEFKKWNTSEDEALDLVLFHYTNPRVAKTYLRCEGIGFKIRCRNCEKSLTLLGMLSLSRPQLIALLLRERLRICAWGQCSAGRNVAVKESDAQRDNCS